MNEQVLRKSNERPALADFRAWRFAAACLCCVLVASCVTGYRSLPSGVYDDDSYTEFEDLPAGLQSPEVNILYITDRQWDENANGGPSYTFHRSPIMEYGYASLDVGEDRSWDELLDWSLSGSDNVKIPLPRLTGVTRKGSFPPTPPLFLDGDDGKVTIDPDWQAAFSEASGNLQREIAGLLALAPVNEIVLTVHGIQNDLQEDASAFALWWHLGGRQRVPIAYSWPAGKKGLLSFYVYDRESGEYTTFHLKQALRLIAEMPEVERIHIVAHSRGTDVALTALRELILVERAAGRDPRQSLKLKNFVMIAADLDFEVVGQRFTAERIWTAFDRVTAYVSHEDKVLSAATSLFGSSLRLGQLEPEDVKEKIEIGRWDDRNVDLVFYDAEKGGFVSGHAYYLTPAVGADLVLLIRGHAPGAENGRPLEKVDDHLFIIRDDYLK